MPSLIRFLAAALRRRRRFLASTRLAAPLPLLPAVMPPFSRNGPAETISLCFQFRNDGDGVHDPPFGFGGCHCRSTGFKSAYQLLDLWTPLSRVPNMLPVFASIHKRKS
jgi:hypothetical protein